MSNPRRVLIVGASLSGLATAEALREHDPSVRIQLLGDEPGLPYDRPPLSKAALFDPSFDWKSLELHNQDWFRDNDIKLLQGEAASLDPSARAVTTADGRRHEYDELVVATGSRERRLEGVDPGPRVFHLRRSGDAARLRAKLGTPGTLVIVGAGFIGLEVAASAHSLGWKVVMLERAEAPLTRVLPPALAETCWRSYAERGVGLVTNATVVGVEDLGERVRVKLADGGVLDGDLALVSAGGIPNTEWLQDEPMPHGIPCNAWGSSHIPHVSAVGDVAAWHNDLTGATRRVEQWQAAKEQASIVAARLAGVATEGWRDPFYFWSDLIAGRVQFLGTASPESTSMTIQIAHEKSITLLGDGTSLTGIFTLNYPRGVARGRTLVARKADWDEARSWATEMADPLALKR